MIIILFSVISISISISISMMIMLIEERRDESSEERIESISLRAEGLPFPKRDKRLSQRNDDKPETSKEIREEKSYLMKKRYRSLFFKTVRRLMKKSGLKSYTGAVRRFISRTYSECDLWKYQKDRFYSEFFEFLQKKGEKKAVREFLFKVLKKNPIKKKIERVNKERKEVLQQEVEEEHHVERISLEEGMSDLLSFGIRPVRLSDL